MVTKIKNFFKIARRKRIRRQIKRIKRRSQRLLKKLDSIRL